MKYRNIDVSELRGDQLDDAVHCNYILKEIQGMIEGVNYHFCGGNGDEALLSYLIDTIEMEATRWKTLFDLYCKKYRKDLIS